MKRANEVSRMCRMGSNMCPTPVKRVKVLSNTIETCYKTKVWPEKDCRVQTGAANVLTTAQECAKRMSRSYKKTGPEDVKKV